MTVVKRRKINREIRHLIAGELCHTAVGGITQGMEVFGLTNGQFSIINLIENALNQTGPADVDVSTWTAAGAEIRRFEAFLANENIKRLRFLVDRSFPARQPKYFQMLLDLFGEDVVRVARTHCKFVVIKNDEWNIAIRTSMNLNENVRTENFEMSDSPDLVLYLTKAVDYFFTEPFKVKGYLLKNTPIKDSEPEENLDNLRSFNDGPLVSFSDAI